MEEIITVTITALLFIILPIPVAVVFGLMVAMRIGYLAYHNREIDQDASLEIQFLGAAIIATVIAVFIPILRIKLLLSFVTILCLLRFAGRALAIEKKKKSEELKRCNELNTELVNNLINKKMNEYFGQLDLLKDKLDQSMDYAMKKANGMMSSEEVEKLLCDTRAQNEESMKKAMAQIEIDFERKKENLQKKYALQLENEKKRIEQQYASNDQAKSEAEAKVKELKIKLEQVIKNDKEALEYERESACKRLEEIRRRYETEHNKLEQTIKSLNNKILQIYEEQDAYIQELENKSATENEIVEAAEIRKKFNKALRTAKRELDIFSPWMNRHVVNENLVNSLEQLLQKGVVVKIRYGIGQGVGSGSQDRNNKTEIIAQELIERFSKYKNFHIYKDNSHAKLYMCDDEFYVLSSFNILSYDGGLNGKDKRGELGEYSTNKKMIDAYRNKYFFF